MSKLSNTSLGEERCGLGGGRREAIIETRKPKQRNLFLQFIIEWIYLDNTNATTHVLILL